MIFFSLCDILKHREGLEMKNKKQALTILLLCMLLCGCRTESKKSTGSVPVLVTQVEIRYIHESAQLKRCYTTPDKMDTVLYYLYALRPHSRAEAIPEKATGDRCSVLVTLSNGQSRTYQLLGGIYFSDDGTTWHRVDQKQTGSLLFLLAQMESD